MQIEVDGVIWYACNVYTYICSWTSMMCVLLCYCTYMRVRARAYMYMRRAFHTQMADQKKQRSEAQAFKILVTLIALFGLFGGVALGILTMDQ